MLASTINASSSRWAGATPIRSRSSVAAKVQAKQTLPERRGANQRSRRNPIHSSRRCGGRLNAPTPPTLDPAAADARAPSNRVRAPASLLSISRAARRYRCQFLFARIRAATSARCNASSWAGGGVATFRRPRAAGSYDFAALPMRLADAGIWRASAIRAAAESSQPALRPRITTRAARKLAGRVTTSPASHDGSTR